MKRLGGSTAFLTGAASGIGRELAVQLAECGCHLFLVDIDGGGLESLQSELRGRPVNVWTAVCDLADSASISAVVAHALQVTGRIDLLVNNAGVAYYGPTDRMTQQQWNWLLGINLLAPVQITQALLPSLLQSPDAHIVNMCSISGLVAGGRFAAYHTSKFGLVGFTEALRAEYGRRGLGVTAICPGPVTTNLYSSAASGRSDRAVPVPPRWLCTTPQRVAAVTIRAIQSNRRQVLITPLAHGLFLLKRFFPGLIDFVNQFSRRGRRKSAGVSANGSERLNPIETATSGGADSAASTRSRRAA